jgi:hypothetical protein
MQVGADGRALRDRLGTGHATDVQLGQVQPHMTWKYRDPRDCI